MQQEDDLRGLAKVMDFMRAISILFVVIHIYWYCYEQILEWGVDIGVVDKVLLNFNRTTGLFGNLLYTKLCAVLFLFLSCLGTTGVKDEKDYMAGNRHGTRGGLRVVLSELVAARPASAAYGDSDTLHYDNSGRIYLPVNGRRMDVPPVEERPDGRPVQQRERKFYAGNAIACQ